VPLFEKSHRLRDLLDRSWYVGTALVHLPTSALAWLAVDLTHLGYIDQGRARMREAFGEARRIEHARNDGGLWLQSGPCHGRVYGLRQFYSPDQNRWSPKVEASRITLTAPTVWTVS
jgi:hypothetical protein